MFYLCVILFCYIKHWQSYGENQRAKKKKKMGKMALKSFSLTLFHLGCKRKTLDWCPLFK